MEPRVEFRACPAQRGGSAGKEAAGKGGSPLAAKLARRELYDFAKARTAREGDAREAATAVIRRLNGSLPEAIDIHNVGRRVRGSVTVPAGEVMSSRMIMGPGGREMVVERTNSMDDRIASMVIGYGEGALDVTYRVEPVKKADGASAYRASYRISTNDSLACLPERGLQVLVSLADAAALVERALAPAADNVVEFPSRSGTTAPLEEPAMASQVAACRSGR